ncbi:MAG: FKBP-type peptidyl-prolyl cis-trans isomerase [Gordonia sp. (in: high G+C Gram-positive bacteria)]|uniref:FKBP-type peptidyl-prolyl cis-trans isomerase n=1 Tax=Gordonia sp. (in: high G+C Gram-positive bacteria) TaxID=84139 RepID=UPI0039E695DA
MKRNALLLAPVAAAALLLAGCSSDASDSESSETTTVTAQPTEPFAAPTPGADGCPTAAPAADAKAQWTVEGTAGKAEILGQSDTAAPRVVLTAPFTVDKTEVKTLVEGTGATVTEASTVKVCYMGVNGRDGTVFDSAYERGAAAEFGAGEVIPGFRQALVGQKVGSTVAVVIPSDDGYPQGTPDGSIAAGDTIMFALKILAMS